MRSLSLELLAAQQSASTEPQVDVVVTNSIVGARRLEFTLLDSTAQPIARHDIAVAGDGSVTRVRIDSGNVKQQRVTNPAAGPWTSWSNITTGIGTQVACAAKSARVAIVYVDAAGMGVKLKESTDNGATFGAEQAIATAAAAVVDLAVAYKNNSGDMAIAWVTTTTVSIIKRATGTFGAAATTTPGVSSFGGIAMTYGFDWDIAITGVEATTFRPTLWTLVYGDGNDAALNAWGTLLAQQQAESDALVTYKAPSIALTDTYRINYVEADAFPGGSTRVYRTWLHPFVTFVTGAFTTRTPVPVNYGGIEGLAIAADASGGGYVYESAHDAVYRAAQPQVQATLSPNVLAVSVDQLSAATRGYIDLDNSTGAYAGPPAPIAIGNLVGISWGYRTAAGVPGSRMPDAWISGYEYRRSGGIAVLRLLVEGGWETLRRSRQRAQVVHTADSYFTILIQIFSRAGLQLTASGISSRASSVVPKFTISPDSSAFESTQRALSYLADRIVMRTGAGASIIEPLPTAAADYTFGAAHPLRSVRLLSEPPLVTEAQALAAATFGEAIDFPSAALGFGSREQQRDATSTTGAAATATAVAHLRQRALDSAAGSIVVPPNCGQEILDVVTFSDALIAPAAIMRRIAAIHWRFDRRRAVYEQELHLGKL